MTPHLERINRCVRSTLAHQRKLNEVDIFMILQRVDYKINRQPLGHKLVDEMRYATVWDIQDAKQNLIYAMDYLFDVEKYPYIDDKLIDGLVNTAKVVIHEKQVGYTSMEWSMEEIKMVQTTKYKSSWSISRRNWDGLIQYLPHIFENLHDAHKWLNHNYLYVPRSLD